MSQKYLVFGGKTGWIGIQLVEMLKAQGKDVTAAASRIENLSAISEVLFRVAFNANLVCLSQRKIVTGVGRCEADPCAHVSWLDWTAERGLVRIQQGRDTES